ncbi:MAG TPA: hypothetical protein VGJ77_22090 [Gaiellaceae bacterium]
MLALVSLVVALTLPQNGVLAPGRSLGGAHLGDTRAAVVARWGSNYGVCRGCERPTLYWNYRRFDPQGAGATFRRGRVVALVTLWAPSGWKTTKGLLVNDNEARVTELYSALPRVSCEGYDALTLRSRDAVTAIYVRLGAVWGFGLMRPSEPLCR